MIRSLLLVAAGVLAFQPAQAGPIADAYADQRPELEALLERQVHGGGYACGDAIRVEHKGLLKGRDLYAVTCENAPQADGRVIVQIWGETAQDASVAPCSMTGGHPFDCWSDWLGAQYDRSRTSAPAPACGRFSA